jgi:hypothetical protein
MRHVVSWYDTLEALAHVSAFFVPGVGRHMSFIQQLEAPVDERLSPR